MANTITLRAYLDELEHLLDARSPTEVISHCRHVLQHYPRNVDAYRLLGRALLERGERDDVAEHYDEALEMFQRVLSVLPNDSLAHLGVSQIFQEKGELERAIWHLERAYEQMPGNQALQEALRELYAQRSGTEVPSRLQLTRGALAHQYIRAQQYEQALVELRAALAETSDRLDLQVLLAEVLWTVGHPDDAAEQAAHILEDLPDCLEANRILARYWLEHERPSDAQAFLERIERVDPYEARRTLQPDTDAPDPNRLSRLDYGTQSQMAGSSETPDWVDELGDLGDFAMEQGSPFGTQPKDSAAAPDVSALFGVLSQAEPEAPPIEPPASFEAPPWPEPEAPPMPAAPAVDDGAPLDLGMDWLAEADLNAPEPEASASTPDAMPLPSDWLDEAAEPGADEGVEVATTGESALPLSPEDDWFSEVTEAAPASAPEPASAASTETSPSAPLSADEDAAWLFAAEEAKQSLSETEEQDAEQPSTGFTGLLAEIQTQRTVQDVLWDAEEKASAPEPEPPDWLSDFVKTDDAASAEPGAKESQASEAPAADDTSLAEAEVEAQEAVSAPADLSDLFGEAEDETVSASTAILETSEERSASLDAPEWLVEPEYDFFAPEETVSPETAAVSAEVETASQEETGETGDWLSTLEETEEETAASEPVDDLLSVADEWKTAEEQGDELDWLSAENAPADEETVDALFAAVEQAASAEPETSLAEELLQTETSEPIEAAQPLAAETEDDWLSALPSDEEVLTAVEFAETETASTAPDTEVEALFAAVAEDAVSSELEPTEADEPLAFEAVAESPSDEEEPASPPLTSSLEERIAQLVQNEESPAWLAGMEAEVSSDEGEHEASGTVEYRAVGQTGVLQPDEAPAWMAAFTGEDVPAEPEIAELDEAFGAPEPEITPAETVSLDETAIEAADELTTRILEPESADVPDESALFGEAAEPSVGAEFGLDTDELFADVLGEATDAADENETTEEGELPAWLQAITQSEADKLDETLFEEAGTYSNSAEDSGILQPGQEDEWLHVFDEEAPAGVAMDEEIASAVSEPSTPEDESGLSYWGEETAAEDVSVEETPLAADLLSTAAEDEAVLDFLDADAAAIAEMDFEGVAETSEAVALDALDMFGEMVDEAAPPEILSEESLLGTVAEAPDLSHTRIEEARAAHDEDETSQAAAPEDDFSFDGLVPHWLRRPRENISTETSAGEPEDDAPPNSPEWLRDVPEDLDRQDDQDDLL